MLPLKDINVDFGSYIDSRFRFAAIAKSRIRIKKSHVARNITKNGTTGSFSLVRCNWSSSEHKLMKPAIEITLTDAKVSFLILIFR